MLISYDNIHIDNLIEQFIKNKHVAFVSPKDGNLLKKDNESNYYSFCVILDTK